MWRKGTLLVAALGLAFLLGYGLRGGDRESGAAFEAATAQVEQAAIEEAKVFACPMACVPPMKEPGNCPICGMSLVAVSASEHEEGASPRLKLSQDMRKASGVETAPAARKFVTAEVRLFGRIDYDPAHMSFVNSFVPGVIDRVFVKRPGQFVRWGQPLFSIYSSDILTAQQQLLEAYRYVPGFLEFQKSTPHVAREVEVQPLQRSKDPKKRSLEEESAIQTIDAIRRKLTILGLPKRDIDEFMTAGEATGLATVYSPLYGQVIEQKAFEGTFVNRGTSMFVIGDPKHVWLRLDSYETDYPWLRQGQEVTFETDAYPGEVFQGKVITIDPQFKVNTRTFDIGVIFPDQGGRMKSGMLVRAVIHAKLTSDGRIANDQMSESRAPLVIPASAPLITGKRAVVYVAVQDREGVFEGREIVLGPKAKDHYVVLGGLKEGEQVVINGNFKIDSAVQILARSSMMSLSGGHPALGHHHHGGSEVMEEDYQSDRMKSRVPGPADSEQTEHSVRPQVSGSEKTERTAVEKSGRPTINRRRPGLYGDSTRAVPLAPGR
jgi:Cu(I)/Ag(I) efflux system membrane fusion protein